MKALSVFAPALLACAVPAFASVTVASPVNGGTVSTPFTLIAAASPCSSQAIASMGYSLDNSTNTTIVNATSMTASVSAALGVHVLHVKSWGNHGASCVTSVTINVAQPTTNVNVSAPLNGATLASPFPVAASGSYCEGQPIAAMGYSLDNSSNTTVVNGTSLGGEVTASSGAHVLHVKAWGNQGASCVNNLAVDVTTPAASPSTSAGPEIPSSAVVVKNIQALPTWQAAYDSATGNGGAWATGATTVVTAPALSNAARQFVTNYSNYAGERYAVKIGTDATPENFVYDTWVYLTSPINDIANVEMDINQVMKNGQTVIFGFQCDGWSRTWDYTENTGTPTQPNDQWIHSNQTCNPQAWSANAWHHIQVSYSRDSSGDVTYKSVWFDGAEQDLNVTAPSAFALGWGPSQLTNFQIDGMTSTMGSATVYLDKFTISSW